VDVLMGWEAGGWAVCRVCCSLAGAGCWGSAGGEGDMADCWVGEGRERVTTG